jgi:CRP-like cAMP-binding protein
MGTELGALPLFAGVPDGELARVADRARTTSLALGQTLLREGDPGDEVLLILDGEAAVTVGGLPVGTIQAGDCVGEMSLLDNAPRSATVTSSTPLRALVLPADAMRQLLADHPVVAQRLTSTLTARLRSAQTGWAGLAGDPDVLLASLLDLQDSPDPHVAERARRQAATLVERAAAQAHVEPDALALLSPAERKVAALVADGLSNQAIADALILSRHTVDTHVKRCFAKLGLRSRVELATAVLRSGRS